MIRRAVTCLLMASGIFVAPLVPVGTRLLDLGPWLGVVAAFVTLLSQPPVPRREWLDTQAPDRRSALLIFVAMIAAQLAAVMDFGYGGAAGRTAWWTFAELSLVGGTALVLAGLALRLWAIRTLGRWFTPTVKVARGQRVVRAGPYRVLRHPSYTGALLVGLGTTWALGSGMGASLVLLFAMPVYLYRIQTEERALVGAFGRDYEEYRGSTWRLVPFIY
jgi:protein-S-isoprenylcysteine O-methyltransferase Ste14